MRGPVGSEIIITVVREGEDEPFDVSIIPRHDQIDRCADTDRGRHGCLARHDVQRPDLSEPQLWFGRADRNCGWHGERETVSFWICATTQVVC